MPFEIIDLSSKHKSPANSKSFAETVLEGLSKAEKRLPSWLIFDDLGSELFSKITQLETYQPAISEKNNLYMHRKDISDIVASDFLQLIELGAGDGNKTMILIEQFLEAEQPLHFIPIDISPGAVKNLVSKLESKHSDTPLKVSGVIGDYFHGMEVFTRDKQKTNLVLFLGLTLGNRDLPEANTFLKQVFNSLNNGDFMLAGFDLFSDPKNHYRAYNDPEGAFENFNLHILDRINRELGANFNKEQFAQEGHYNWRTHAVESYLYSLKSQTVWVEAFKREFHFRHGEGMQTEHSHKYTLREIEELAENNGFNVVKNLLVENETFVNSIWRVNKHEQ